MCIHLQSSYGTADSIPCHGQGGMDHQALLQTGKCYIKQKNAIRDLGAL